MFFIFQYLSNFLLKKKQSALMLTTIIWILTCAWLAWAVGLLKILVLNISFSFFLFLFSKQTLLFPFCDLFFCVCEKLVELFCFYCLNCFSGRIANVYYETDEGNETMVTLHYDRGVACGNNESAFTGSLLSLLSSFFFLLSSFFFLFLFFILKQTSNFL